MNETRQTEEEEIHLRDYLEVLLKRRNTILTFFGVIVAVVSIGTLTTTPVYKATTRVLIDRESIMANMKDIYYEPYYAEDYYQTQYELIKSGAVAQKVVKNLNLEANPAFNPAMKAPEGGLIRSLLNGISAAFTGKKEEGPGPAPHLLSTVIAKTVQGGVRVEPVKNSRIVNISYEHSDPRLAAALADGIADAYVEQVLDIRMGTAKQAVEWMSKKIDEQKVKLEDSQRALQEYMKDRDVVELENKEALTPMKLQSLSSQLVVGESKKKEAEALYDQVKNLSHNLDEALTVPAIAGDPVIQALRSEEIRIEKDIMEMSKKFGEKHPQMIRLKEDLRATRERMTNEVKRVITAVRNDYELAKAREANVRSLLARGKGEALVLSEKAFQYGVLKRDVETNQQLYEALLKRIKETSLVEEVKSFNISIIDRAEVPRSPIRPKSFLNIFLSVVAGLLGGVGIAFFLEYLDNTFNRPELVEEKLSLPLLSVIPLVRKKEVAEGKIETITHTDQRSPIAESFRALRTSILLSSSEPIKAFVVTSALEDEGKTTTAINLGIALAQMGKKVLLVDADLRKPRVHHVFGVENLMGLSSYLTHQVHEEIVRETGIQNLSFAPAGPIPPNPSELLSSSRMKEFMGSMMKHYDVVILDAAPIVTVTDTLIISSLVDGTILVVRSGRTTFDLAKRGVKLLRDIDSKILGVVLNGMDTSREGYRYLYPYYQYGTERETSV